MAGGSSTRCRRAWCSSMVAEAVMAKEFDNTNRGCLFNNRARKENEKQPDYWGFLDVRGEEFRVTAWLRTSKKGTQYLSLAIQPKEEMVARRAEVAGTEVNRPLKDTHTL